MRYGNICVCVIWEGRTWLLNWITRRHDSCSTLWCIGIAFMHTTSSHLDMIRTNPAETADTHTHTHTHTLAKTSPCDHHPLSLELSFILFSKVIHSLVPRVHWFTAVMRNMCCQIFHTQISQEYTGDRLCLSVSLRGSGNPLRKYRAPS